MGRHDPDVATGTEAFAGPSCWEGCSTRWSTGHQCLHTTEGRVQQHSFMGVDFALNGLGTIEESLKFGIDIKGSFRS